MTRQKKKSRQADLESLHRALASLPCPELPPTRKFSTFSTKRVVKYVAKSKTSNKKSVEVLHRALASAPCPKLPPTPKILISTKRVFKYVAKSKTSNKSVVSSQSQVSELQE